jgi:hypothetical protein
MLNLVGGGCVTRVVRNRAGHFIPDYQFRQSELMKYRIPHLWPGEWTIRLLKKDNIITTTRVRISGRESVRTDLVVVP